MAAKCLGLVLALKSMHEKQLVHQDVHDGHILLTPDGAKWVLAGFGSAVWVMQPGNKPTCLEQSM